MSVSTFTLTLVVAHLLAAGISIGLGLYIYGRFRTKPIARVFTAMVLAFGVWTLGSLVRTFTVDPTVYVGLTTLKYAGVTTAPVFFFLFSLYYADGQHYVSRRVVAGLLVIPVLALAALATTTSHGLFYESFAVTEMAGREILDTTRGPAFWSFAIYGYGLLALGSALLVYGAYGHPALYRTHAAIVVVGIVVPWAASLAYIFADWPHTAVDPTPLGFAIASLLWGVGVFSRDLVDVSPVARSRVVSAIDDPVVVVDEHDRVIDVNDAVRPLVTSDRPYGERVTDALVPALRDTALLDAPGTGEDSDYLEVPIDGSTRHFQYRTVPLGDGGEYGAVLVLSDVTELRTTQRELEAKNAALEQQNERLDQFASIVSHDLRNPLQVAQGHLDLLAEERDSDHVEPIEQSLSRIEQMTNDLLELAREGETIGETTPVAVDSLARRAWENVPATDATLEVGGDPGAVRADADRLTEALENLFRNAVEHGSTSPRSATPHEDAVEHGSTSPPSQAQEDPVEHGGPDVTIRVGPLSELSDEAATGFYVADDGPGIPESERDRVFEYGFSTGEGSTGFGLTIVDTIVESHGWEIRVTEGDEGGARFEIRTG